MSMFLLYLFVMLDNIGTWFFIIALCGFFGGAVGYVVCLIYISFRRNDDKPYDVTPDVWNEKLKEDTSFQKVLKLRSNFFKAMIIIPIVFGTLTTFMPSTKQMAFIYIVSHISQSDVANRIANNAVAIPDKALEMLNVKTRQYLHFK